MTLSRVGFLYCIIKALKKLINFGFSIVTWGGSLTDDSHKMHLDTFFQTSTIFSPLGAPGIFHALRHEKYIRRGGTQMPALDYE